MSNESRSLWESSAEAWLARVDSDPNRTHLLDAVMIELCGPGAGIALDLGCGEGRFCRLLQPHGWETVGLDVVTRFLERARDKDPRGRYLAGSGEAMPVRSNSVDLVVSYLTLLDIPDSRAAAREMERILKPGGRIVLANCTPFFTPMASPWMKNERGEKLHLKLDDYVREHPVRLSWAGIDIVNYHRSMKDSLRPFLDLNLRLTHFDEPQPNEETLREFPHFDDFGRVPNFHTMVWLKD